MDGGRARGGRAGVIYQEFDVGRSLARSLAPASSSAARSPSRHSRSRRRATAPFHCRNNRGRYASSRDEEEARRRDASSEGREGGRSDPEIKNMMKRRRKAARSGKGKVGAGARNRLLGKTIAARISRGPVACIAAFAPQAWDGALHTNTHLRA